jgi:curli biogenesis system outer membrane secretion channel CsgG
MERVKEKCKDIAVDKRITITVARFNTTVGNAPRDLGQNMAAMLTNALGEVNCFNVLESQGNMKDLTNEVDFGSSEYASGESAVEKGQMKSAQVVITGEITEFNKKSSNNNYFGYANKSSACHLGFVLKLVNPRTREILKNHSFNVDAKTGAGSSYSFFGVRMTNNGEDDPAIANALEQGVIQAVEYITDEKESIPLPAAKGTEAAAAENKMSLVVITGIDYEKVKPVMEQIKSSPKVTEASKSYDNSTLTVTVHHKGTSDDLADAIAAKLGSQYKITGVVPGKIKMSAK